eukprot:TRINITY_DN67755_c7_g2_i1.p1 TRINITY_DN67755_c7_g2~~TRINITY_DN67755_c7_g2_i1.p1  ORF type:complete len:296 (-),score=41.43 TRINITY_DN67755_c7_g2_i1:31-918(-)
MTENLSSQYSAVSSAFEAFIDQLKRIQNSTQEQWDQIKAIRAEQESKVKQCSTTSSSKIVTLDIGGTVFKTTEETLLSQPNTFFSAMLGSGNWHPDPTTGTYFIDRSPGVFNAILDYLRTGQEPNTYGWTEQDKRYLDRDLDFYGMGLTTKGACWQPAISFTDMNHTVVVPGTTNDTFSDLFIYTTTPQSGTKFFWKFTCTSKCCDGGDVNFGGAKFDFGEAVLYVAGQQKWEVSWQEGVTRCLQAEFDAATKTLTLTAAKKPFTCKRPAWDPSTTPPCLNVANQEEHEQVWSVE